MTAPDPAVLGIRQWGAAGPVVVLLHGFGGLGAVWRPVGEVLGRTCRVIAYDLPGHGDSLNFPGGGPVRVAVRAVAQDLAARGIDVFHLVGHSMGGAIAALMAIAEPDRVASLTLLAPGGMGDEISAPLLERFARAADADELCLALKEMCGPAMWREDLALNHLAAARAVSGQTDMLLSIAAAITRGGRQGLIPAEALMALPMPVTVLWGTLDAVLPYAQTGNLPDNFEVVTIANAGHMLVEEAPGLVTDTIRAQVRSDNPGKRVTR